MRRTILPLLFVIAFAVFAVRPSTGVAQASGAGAGFVTLLLVDGKIWTEDPAHPEVEAVAIDGNTIVATGTTAMAPTRADRAPHNFARERIDTPL